MPPANGSQITARGGCPEGAETRRTPTAPTTRPITAQIAWPLMPEPPMTLRPCRIQRSPSKASRTPMTSVTMRPMSANVPRRGSRLGLTHESLVGSQGRQGFAGRERCAEAAGRRAPRGSTGGPRAAGRGRAGDRHRHPRTERPDGVPGADPAPRPDRADDAAAPRRHVPLLLRDRWGAHARRVDVPPRDQRPGRPPDRPHAGRPPRDAADRAGPRLPVRDRLAGAAGALERGEVVHPPRRGPACSPRGGRCD